MSQAQIGIMISIVLYLSVVVIIGVIYSKRTKNVGDFYLGGRKLGPLVTAMSAEASDMSSWLLMGLPGVALLAGCAEAGWTAIGLALGTYLNWLIVAKRLRNYSADIGAITIPDFFSRRYRENKNILMAIAALVIIIFFVPYTASGFAACGKLFETLFGIDYHIAMVVSAIIIVGYTSLGGFNAASTTDFIQSIIMTVALIIVLVYGVAQAGGIDAVNENAKSLPGYLEMFNTYDPATGKAISYSTLTIFSLLAWGLGYFGMPHILLRFMAIEKPEKIKLSRRVATVWVVISMAIAVIIGIVGNAMVANKANGFNAIGDSERIIVEIAKLLANHGFIPALVAGVILAGILASTMSTSDSQLLAASSSASENIIGGLFKKRTQRNRTDGSCQSYAYCNFRNRRYRCVEQGFVSIQNRIVRLGRLWCCIRPCNAACTVLETFKQIRCNSRYDCRRCNGIYLEVRHCKTRRSICNLRTSARIHFWPYY